jgi:hypothetical protein
MIGMCRECFPEKSGQAVPYSNNARRRITPPNLTISFCIAYKTRPVLDLRFNFLKKRLAVIINGAGADEHLLG